MTRKPASQDRRNRAGGEQPPLLEGFRFLLHWRNRSRIGYVVVPGVVALIIGAAIGIPALSYNGFCLGKGRFLSDQEYVDIAISQIMRLRCYQTVVPGKCVPPTPYNDIADFRARNPDCCKFVWHNSDYEPGIVTFSQQLFGYAAKSVVVNFKVSYADEDGHRQDGVAQGLVVVGNCGSILNTGH